MISAGVSRRATASPSSPPDALSIRNPSPVRMASTNSSAIGSSSMARMVTVFPCRSLIRLTRWRAFTSVFPAHRLDQVVSRAQGKPLATLAP